MLHTFVKVVYSVILVILYFCTYLCKSLFDSGFQPKHVSSRKWKFDLLNREIWDQFAVCFVRISLWEMFEEWISPLNQLSWRARQWQVTADWQGWWAVRTCLLLYCSKCSMRSDMLSLWTCWKCAWWLILLLLCNGWEAFGGFYITVTKAVCLTAMRSSTPVVLMERSILASTVWTAETKDGQGMK